MSESRRQAPSPRPQFSRNMEEAGPPRPIPRVLTNQEIIDLDFRPDSYFISKVAESDLLASVRSRVLRERLQALLDEGREAEVREMLAFEGLEKGLQSSHPMFMGGCYLPEQDEGEVEIGNILIKSVGFDVTSVYAKRDGDVIRYRVVDEHEGCTLEGPTETESVKPLSLGEFIDFFFKGWPLLEVIETNVECDLEGSLDFFRAYSDFYPDFDRRCRQIVTELCADRAEKDEDGWGEV